MTGSQRRAELAERLAALRARLAAAAADAGRRVEEIELLPVTKYFPATDVAILASLGCGAFGESRDQEATAKIAAVGTQVRWHMVGQVQRNKARSIAGWAAAVHSVSSAKVAAALGRAAAAARDDGRRGEPLGIYVQLSLDGDTSRGGVDIGAPEAVDALCAAVHDDQGLRLAGLMAIPPLGADADDAFARLAAEHQRVQGQYQQRLGLSAGMSGDLEAAVKHGSTCVRVGTALMGSRGLTSP